MAGQILIFLLPCTYMGYIMLPRLFLILRIIKVRYTELKQKSCRHYNLEGIKGLTQSNGQ